MEIQVRQAAYQEIEALRELYRQEANCQIIHDSILRRGMADPYLILAEGRIAGYGGIWNKHCPGRVMEFYTLPRFRSEALPMFRELLAVSQATHIEAQTNMPLMLTMLLDCAAGIAAESILFEDACVTHLTCPEGVFRRAASEDTGTIFDHKHEPVGDWVVEANGAIVATGGFLCHYNPPYGDIYMEVAETARMRGYGSYLVQEVKRACYEAGKKPAARCHRDNVASRRTLQKAGMLPCGHLLVGKVAV